MESKQKTSHNLFEVYLRLRPPPTGTPSAADKILNVEEDEDGSQHKSHVTLNPPTDRRRAIEKFAFTQVFEEDASQLDVFHCAEIVPLVEGVMGPQGGEGTDAAVATLGVTGSGKTHTILGSKTQRGITQLALDVLFRSIGPNMLDSAGMLAAQDSLQACDPSESTLCPAPVFLESTYYDTGMRSRAATPMIVRPPDAPLYPKLPLPIKSPPATPSKTFPSRIPCTFPNSAQSSPKSVRLTRLPTATAASAKKPHLSPKRAGFMSLTAATRSKTTAKSPLKGENLFSPQPGKKLQRPSALPQVPDVSGVNVSCDPSAEHVVVVSMYEVHNDRIYDLLTPATKTAVTKEYRRRPLLFKSTELSPDRKVVAGLRKVICTTFKEAIMVLEAGLQERRVAGTGSNSVSSRSHGFFCFEVRKRVRSRRPGAWGGSRLTVVDLAGSERAREAKTAGATLVEAGKINESLMYLGQCLQTQSEAATSAKPNIVPYRQCKLTELLFSNSFPSSTSASTAYNRRNPQRGVMIVTADPRGDFNATSQILRYSALAREVTVPRIPSITATILANGPPSANPIAPHPPSHHPRPFVPPGSSSGSATALGSGSYRSFSPDDRTTMEIAAMEIARLSDEIDQLRLEVDYQTEGRNEAEAHLLSLEDKMLELEALIREECATEFEERLALELARCKASFAVEQERSDEHWDKKVDVLERGLDHYEEAGLDKENVLIENLEEEVDRLRRENAVLKRELAGRSPTKRRPLEERDDFSTSGSGAAKEGVSNLGRKLERMRVSGEGRSSAGSVSPKKTRRTRQTDPDMMEE